MELCIRAPGAFVFYKVAWLLRLSRVSIALPHHHKCRAKMAFGAFDQANACFQVASVQQQYGEFHAAI